MELVFSDERAQRIKEKEEIPFSSFSALHLIIVTGRAKHYTQISPQSREHERITVGLDDAPLLQGAVYDGGKLRNLSQTIYLFTFLRGENHHIILTTNPRQPTAMRERIQVYRIDAHEQFELKAEVQAEDGDRRPWLVFIFHNLPLASATLTVSYSRRKRDSDDVRIILDGQTQKNIWKRLKYSLWRFVGSLLPSFTSRTETEMFSVPSTQPSHVVEIYADRMPRLERIQSNFGSVPQPPADVPSVEIPRWTGDFADDTEGMLLARAIYGESGGEFFEAKVGVGWAIRNRVEDTKQRWGKTYHEVILQPGQYEPFSNTQAQIFQRITNPPLENPLEKKAWEESFQAAKVMLSGSIQDPTGGANHFFSTISGIQPTWADETRFIVAIGNTRFYKL